MIWEDKHEYVSDEEREAFQEPELVSCPYCGELADLVDGSAIYPHRSDLYHKMFWRCVPCDARVGCHGGSETPLGTLADAETREARSEAHTYFDTLWRNNGVQRKAAYLWLREQMGLSKEDCHIACFTVEQCAQVKTVVQKHPNFDLMGF